MPLLYIYIYINYVIIIGVTLVQTVSKAMATHARQVFSGDKCGGAHLPRIAAQLLKCPTKDIAAIPA